MFTRFQSGLCPLLSILRYFLGNNEQVEKPRVHRDLRGNYLVYLSDPNLAEALFMGSAMRRWRNGRHDNTNVSTGSGSFYDVDILQQAFTQYCLQCAMVVAKQYMMDPTPSDIGGLISASQSRTHPDTELECSVDRGINRHLHTLGRHRPDCRPKTVSPPSQIFATRPTPITCGQWSQPWYSDF